MQNTGHYVKIMLHALTAQSDFFKQVGKCSALFSLESAIFSFFFFDEL